MNSSNFQWDEEKRQRVWENRRVDLVRAALMFEGYVWEERDPKDHDGEERIIAVGEVSSEIFVLVYTKRGDTCRLITAWKAGKNVRAEYQARKPRSNS
jgi:uncharacterized protein